uniref:Uncharacterized protein n=1 Tax=Cacopsylla melanoneura TaxID=428564 RepID=A0A8D9B0I7_9HEMI
MYTNYKTVLGLLTSYMLTIQWGNTKNILKFNVALHLFPRNNFVELLPKFRRHISCLSCVYCIICTLCGHTGYALRVLFAYYGYIGYTVICAHKNNILKDSQ